MSLSRGEGVALWRQIAEALDGEIDAGNYGPGDRLPTEFDLAKRFDVNRHTVRRAVASLAERGLVRIEQGRGTFVQEEVIDYKVGRRTRWSENVSQPHRSTEGRILEVAREAAEQGVADVLEISVGAPVIRVDRLGIVDDRPLTFGSHYFDAARFPTIGEAAEQTGSISRALQRIGIPDYIRRITRIMTALPNAEEARLLQQPNNRPILISEGINTTPDGKPLELSIGRHNGQRVHLIFEPEG